MAGFQGLTFSRTSRNVAPAKRRHVVRRVRPRARPASAGRALELSGCETAVGIECDAPVAAKLPGRPTDQDLQAVCRRRIDVLIGCSAAQVGGVTRPADHPFAARRCLTIEPVAHRQSSEYPTKLWASGCMGWPLDASRGLPQEQQVARAPQARCDRVLCRYCATTMPIGSTVAEVVTDSTLVAHLSLAHLAVVRCAVAAQQPTLEAQNPSGWPNCVSCRVTLLIS